MEEQDSVRVSVGQTKLVAELAGQYQHALSATLEMVAIIIIAVCLLIAGGPAI
jgi:uncharacterized membrane protein YdfJ with MMPL/SSD domain